MYPGSKCILALYLPVVLIALRYILQAFAWARKYGLRIYLDLHTIPGIDILTFV